MEIPVGAWRFVWSMGNALFKRCFGALHEALLKMMERSRYRALAMNYDIDFSLAWAWLIPEED